MRIALATCEDPPVPDADAGPLSDALAELGAEAEQPAWNDSGVDWSSFDLVQLSSTWDYNQRLGEFREWLGRVEGETRLENPRELVEWNLDKRYLAELAEAEVPIIPTVWSEVGEEGEAAEEAARRGWKRIVVKPVVDLGAQRLRRVGPNEVAAALEEIGEPSLVQPFLGSIGRSGELSIAFFRGELSHAILKRPAEGEFRIHEHFGGTYKPVEPPPSAVEVTDHVIALLAAGEVGPASLPGTPPLYARVDLVSGPRGEPCVIEVELIEPAFYLHVAGPEAAARFAAHLVE
ncbi:MAG: ATP-grasp domain-containing protein [Solirubrobacterales bacterium]